MILAAFLFFLLCVGWIIKRRVLDRVVGGVGWWIGGSFKLLGMGLGIGRGRKSVSVGAGKVGSSPEGLGRVGLAGGREKPGLGSASGKGDGTLGQEVSIIDSAVPPAPSGDSAVSGDPPVASGPPSPIAAAAGRDEL